MEAKKDVIIIGGGVIGLATAHYLLEKGTRVRIIERNEIGKGASHGNCGLLCFSDMIPLCAPGTVSHEMMRTVKGISPLYVQPTTDLGRLLWLLKFALKCNAAHVKQASKDKYDFLAYSMGLFDDLLEQEAIPCDFEKKGLLTVFKDKKYFEKYQSTNAVMAQFGMGGKKIGGDDLYKFEPALKNDLAGAWFTPDDWHLRPDMMMASWRKYLSQNNVTIEEHNRVLDFEIKQGTITRVRTIKGEYTADAFVLATGAWTPETAEKLNLSIPIQPGKGYSITMERPGLCPVYPCLLYEKSMVATPWRSGYRLGGTMEFSGYNDYLNPKRLSRLVDGAKTYLKDPMGDPILEEWTGLRPMVYDDMPVIDRAEQLDNLVIATGHGMLGLTLGPGTGKIVSDLIYDLQPDIDIQPFSLTRFK